MIERLTIIGVGLIGGSLGLALRQAGAVGHVTGVGRGRPNLELALKRGIVDAISTDVADACRDADLVVVAGALGATGSILAQAAPALSAEAVITDVGSSKQSVIDSARATLGNAFARFVPGHPIAGTEQSGAAAAFASLFAGHKVVLTPLDETRVDAVTRVHDMWSATGASVVNMSPQAHDLALAATSHLPHLVAYNLVDALAARPDADEIFAFAAGGFRDFTRIASSSPAMWADIVLNNRAAVLDASRDFAARLAQLIEALEAGDADALAAAFERAKQARDNCVVPESNARD